VVYDSNQARYRPSSAAFEDASDGVSVFLRSVLDTIPRTEEDVLIGYDQHSLVSFLAREVRAFDLPLALVRDPDPPDGPHACAAAHALIKGAPDGNAGRKKFRKPMAELVAEFVVLRAPAE